ncbi:MAG: ATP synthase F1 subunit delta [Acidobacteria bacterium]|nr:ATP synthase F1 subunit delta [Acidobacteriota bacterium]
MPSHVARRYAQALLEALKTPEALEHAERDLAAMGVLFVKLPALARVLGNPGVGVDRKKGLLDGALSGLDCLTESRRVAWLLVEARAIGELPEVVAGFKQLKDRKLGMTPASVTTPSPIPEADRGPWEQALARAAGTRVRIDFRTDTSLIGGAVATVGSVSYDGSVRGSLERIRQTLHGE